MKPRRHEPLRFAGPSLHELLTEEMDKATDRVMLDPDDEKIVGRAIGISVALAIFTNPYDPNPKAIRQQAKNRWRARQEQG